VEYLFLRYHGIGQVETIVGASVKRVIADEQTGQQAAENQYAESPGWH
jgi:hypothetical protein